VADALAGTAALVTGASGGIGAAIAADLAGRGAAVALVARRESALAEVAGRITAAGGRAEVVVADLTDPDQAEAAVERAATALGRLDVVVNNAGLLLLGPIHQAPLSEWDRMLELNLRAVLRVTRAALPHLVAAARSGPRQVADVVNISSIAGRRATANTGVYDATKFALTGFSESLRQEVGPQFVRVCLVEPAFVATGLAAGTRPEVFAAMPPFDPGTPLQATDVAELVGYVVTRPRGVALSEVVVRAPDQAGV
jgi:NADP-dependent 3-hydroxy acid dehydrogenase YdfG